MYKNLLNESSVEELKKQMSKLANIREEDKKGYLSESEVQVALQHGWTIQRLKEDNLIDEKMYKKLKEKK